MGGPQTSDTPFRAGAAVLDITPPLGLCMAGYRRTRLASGVHDPLQVHALVLDDGSHQLALAGVDLICLAGSDIQAAANQIQRQCGIPPDHVLCWATHTHTGPVPEPNIPAGDPDPEYMSLVRRRIADCVQLAQGKLQPAQASVGVGHQENLAFNRRADRRGRPLPPSSSELLGLLRSGIPPPAEQLPMNEWVRAAGMVDPQVGVLHVERLDGSPLALWVNFALHCDTVGGNEYSAGYPHVLRTTLARQYGQDAVVLFANGPCGDINHVDRRRERRKGFGEAARIGTVLAGEVIKVVADSAAQSLIPLRAQTRSIRVPRRTVEPEELEAAGAVIERVPRAEERRERYYADDLLHLAATDEQVDTQVQALRLGSTALVGLPGEIFVELGLEIKRRSPFASTFVVELAGDYVGYVPTAGAFAEGGYEVMTARTSRLAPEAGQAMVDAAVSLLEQLARA